MDCINGQDREFGNFDEFLQVDEALLMSFLDDSQVLEEEYCDKEKLSSVMRSLEAEIDQRIIHADQYTMNNNNNNDNNVSTNYWENDHDLIMEGYDETPGLAPAHVPAAELGCNWMDLEMNGGDYWYNDHDQMATLTLDHYFDQYQSNGVAFEDHDQLVQYGSFWQEP